MAVKDEIDSRGLSICEAGIHGHGLASLEYPRFRHHAIAADREAIKVIGDRFEPGMVFAFNIDLLDPKWREGKTGCVFAETIEITPTARAACTPFRPNSSDCRIDRREEPNDEQSPIFRLCGCRDHRHRFAMRSWRKPQRIASTERNMLGNAMGKIAGKIVGKFVERPRLTILLASLAAMIAAPTASMAQGTDYPNQRITFIVGFAAGGFADTIGRWVAARLGRAH